MDILKEIVKPLLPQQIITRPKKGFGIPIAGWLKDELRPVMESTLNKKRIEREGFFNWAYVQKLMGDHIAGRCNNRKQLFALLVFHWWQDNYLS